MPILSIIVPVYNVRPYIGACLDSICRQTFTNFEVIVVDDGSTDGSADECRRIATADHRFVVISVPNGGVSRARNIGLDHAHGDWVAFVDSDDTLEPDYYEQMFLRQRKDNADVVVSGFTFDYETDVGFRYPGEGRDRKVNGTYKPRDIFRLLANDGGALTCVWDKLIRRSIIEGHHLRFLGGVKLGEDSVFAGMLACVAEVLVIDHSLRSYHYRIRRGSAMRMFKPIMEIQSCVRNLVGVALFERQECGSALANQLLEHYLNALYGKLAAYFRDRDVWASYRCSRHDLEAILKERTSIRARILRLPFLWGPLGPWCYHGLRHVIEVIRWLRRK